MTPEIHLRIVGGLLLLLAALNGVLPKRFHWKEELARLSLLNRQVFLVHALFIALVLVLTGVLSLVFAGDLVEPSRLGAVILSGLTIFWATRLFVQWFVYDHRLWRGHAFNATVHIVFTCIWTYFVAVYGWALWTQLSAF